MVTQRTDDGINVVYKKRQQESATGGEPSGKKARSSAVNSGWGNNFVRIDLKKGRGSTKFKASRRSTTSRRRGRGRWSAQQRLRQVGDGSEFMEGWEGSKTVCYKCGAKGHWARDCAGPTEDLDPDGSEGGEAPAATAPLFAALEPAELDLHAGAGRAVLAPADPLDIDIDALCEPSALEGALCSKFGFESFRGLQLATIQRVLQGHSCLSIMPTGMGKSLCYQLPALLLPGITLVVSPLVALMHDQCRAAPAELNPAVLWSGQSMMEARRVLADVQSGTVRLLFVSPERLANPHLLAVLRPHMPLPLVVIDEAHCVAEWGHSFRPSYFRLGEILQRDFSVRSVLALTATATKATEAAVRSVLRIREDGVLREGAIRDNLRLSVVRRPTGTTAAARAGWDHIVRLFRKGGNLEHSKSAIVYCAWRSDADSLASSLTAGGVTAKSYHAGRDLKERAGVEAAFSSGRLRVVTATVAFGMGIDIASVDAVVHATMPRSVEEYVQQIGRAGRDGREGTCFVYLADDDFISLRSLAYSSFVLKEAVSRVLSDVFAEPVRPDCSTEDEQGALRHFGVLPCKKLAAEVDMQEESIEAVLGYLEADDQPLLRVLPKAGLTVKVSFYAAAAETLIDEHPIVTAVLQGCPKPRNGLYTMPVGKLACLAQKVPGAALQDLQVLAQRKIIGFELSRDQGMAFEVLRQADDLEELAERVHARLSMMLRGQVARLDTSYRTMAAAAAQPSQREQEAALHVALDEYFAKEAAPEVRNASGDVVIDLESLPLRPVGETMLNTARAVLRRNREQGGTDLAPLALARILHGIGTPSLPRDVWSKKMGPFWGSLRDVDFTGVFRVATMACKSSE